MIIGRQSGLGRGLGALIPPKPPAPSPTQDLGNATQVSSSGERLMQIPVQDVVRNPHQPRVHFDHGQLEDLILSIKEHGVIQPITVTRLPDGRYELIAGERRLRASTIAGLATVPAIVREAGEQEKLELALIENIQRQDLNPIEEARAYMRLIDEFHLTQDEVSQKVGKSRPQVGNTVRLLQLPESIQQALVERKISASNARTLLSVPTEAERQQLFEAMIAGHFTVRQAEERVPHPRRARRPLDPNVADAEYHLREKYHCLVEIKRDPKGPGEIRLKFTSNEEFEALIRKLKGEEE